MVLQLFCEKRQECERYKTYRVQLKRLKRLDKPNI